MAQLSGDSLNSIHRLCTLNRKEIVQSIAVTTSIVFSTANGTRVTRVMAVHLLKNDIVGLLCRSEVKTRKTSDYKRRRQCSDVHNQLISRVSGEEWNNTRLDTGNWVKVAETESVVQILFDLGYNVSNRFLLFSIFFSWDCKASGPCPAFSQELPRYLRQWAYPVRLWASFLHLFVTKPTFSPLTSVCSTVQCLPFRRQGCGWSVQPPANRISKNSEENEEM